MVWFKIQEKTTGFFHKKSTPTVIKKFQKNGEPDYSYFGAGMHANYLYEPVQKDMRAYEIFPKLDETKSLKHIATDAPRSFEICKPTGSNTVKLLIRSTPEDIESYAKSLNIEYQDTKYRNFPIVSDSTDLDKTLVVFSDFELEHQFNYAPVDQAQEPIINRLVNAINAKDCGVWLQFLFTTSIHWNSAASFCAQNLSTMLQTVEAGKTQYALTGFNKYMPTFSPQTVPDVQGLSSSVYQLGKKLERPYHEKAHSKPVSLAIRMLTIGRPEVVSSILQNVKSVFGGVSILGDVLNRFDYKVDVDIATKWMTENDISSSYGLRILESNNNMWYNMQWGVGRDMVPFLCLTPDEIPVFVSLPTESDLPIQYRRQRLRGANYNKMIFPLGNTI